MSPTETPPPADQVEPLSTRAWRRFVALGDSFTEGLMDPDPSAPDRYVGWADRLADRLAQRNAADGLDFGYANLAVRGLRLDEVIATQLDAALELTPDLVSLCAGGNDYLRWSVDQDVIADELEDAVVRIRETGADVLLVTAPDISRMPVVRAITHRMAVYTANVWGIAQRNDAFVADIWSLRALRDPALWAEDRIHFTPEGHRRIAAAAAWTLGVDPGESEDWLTPLEPALRLTRLGSVAANRAWAAEHLAPWIGRHLRGQRSGDGVLPKRPVLEPIDAVEVLEALEATGTLDAAGALDATGTLAQSPLEATEAADASREAAAAPAEEPPRASA